MLSSYLLTRNDHTSAFYAIVKVKTLNILVQSENYIKTLKAIRDRITFNAEQFPFIDQFVCKLSHVKSLVPCSITPSSPCEDYGWIVKNDLFQIQWMMWKPVPNELTELISCRYLKSKCLGNQCVSHGLPCADLCSCDF